MTSPVPYITFKQFNKVQTCTEISPSLNAENSSGSSFSFSNTQPGFSAATSYCFSLCSGPILKKQIWIPDLSINNRCHFQRSKSFQDPRLNYLYSCTCMCLHPFYASVSNILIRGTQILLINMKIFIVVSNAT